MTPAIPPGSGSRNKEVRNPARLASMNSSAVRGALRIGPTGVDNNRRHTFLPDNPGQGCDRFGQDHRRVEMADDGGAVDQERVRQGMGVEDSQPPIEGVVSQSGQHRVDKRLARDDFHAGDFP